MTVLSSIWGLNRRVTQAGSRNQPLKLRILLGVAPGLPQWLLLAEVELVLGQPPGPGCAYVVLRLLPVARLPLEHRRIFASLSSLEWSEWLTEE